MTALPKSVEVYVDECAAVLSWLSPDAWLNQHDFDRRSREFHRAGRHRRTIRGFTGETILPPMNGDLNLAVLQQFQLAEMVETRETDGGVEYRLRTVKPAEF
jgi:hypothetical protein